MRKRAAQLLLLFALAFGSGSCRWWGSAKPVAPAPVPLPTPAAPPPSEPKIAPPPPGIDETPNPTPPSIPPEKIVTPPGPKKVAKPVRRRVPPAKTHAEPPATPPVAPIEAPAPRLAQIFTAEQRAEYTRSLDESLERVRRVLAQVQSRVLTEAQAEMINRIRAFERQAQQARDQDLVSAVSLANRADVLARDLIARLQ